MFARICREHMGAEDAKHTHQSRSIELSQQRGTPPRQTATRAWLKHTTFAAEMRRTCSSQTSGAHSGMK